MLHQVFRLSRTRIEGGRYPVALIEQPGQQENGCSTQRRNCHMDLTVSPVTECSVRRPRRQGSAPPRTKRAPLTAPGAGHDHLVTSETVRVRHGDWLNKKPR